MAHTTKVKQCCVRHCHIIALAWQAQTNVYRWCREKSYAALREEDTRSQER